MATSPQPQEPTARTSISSGDNDREVAVMTSKSPAEQAEEGTENAPFSHSTIPDTEGAAQMMMDMAGEEEEETQAEIPSPKGEGEEDEPQAEISKDEGEEESRAEISKDEGEEESRAEIRNDEGEDESRAEILKDEGGEDKSRAELQEERTTATSAESDPSSDVNIPETEDATSTMAGNEDDNETSRLFSPSDREHHDRQPQPRDPLTATSTRTSLENFPSSDEAPENIAAVAAMYEDMDMIANVARAPMPPVPPSRRAALCEELVDDDDAKAKMKEETEISHHEDLEQGADAGDRDSMHVEDAIARGSAAALADSDAEVKRQARIEDRLLAAAAVSSSFNEDEPMNEHSSTVQDVSRQGANIGDEEQQRLPEQQGSGVVTSAYCDIEEGQASLGADVTSATTMSIADQQIPVITATTTSITDQQRLSISHDNDGVPVLEATLVDDGHIIYDARPINDNRSSKASSGAAAAGGDNKNGGSSQRPRGILWALALAVVVAVALGAYISTRGSGDNEADASAGNSSSDEKVTSEPDDAVGSVAPSPANTAPLETLPYVKDEEDDAPPANNDGGEGPTYVSTISISSPVNETSPMIWKQIGSTINGGLRDQFGVDVAVSNNGKILAVGAPFNNDAGPKAGHVRVYVWNETLEDWSQRGLGLYGDAEQDRFGTSVALSGDGNILAAGAPTNGENDSGQIKIFKWNETLSTYVTFGTLDKQWRGSFPCTWELLGWDVDLSDDGLTVAVGAPFSGAIEGLQYTSSKAHVRVYRWNDTAYDWTFVVEEYPSGDWSPMGSQIEGESYGDLAGQSGTISADGRTVAIGAPFPRGSNETGSVRVLAWDDNDGVMEWVPMGSTIHGEAGGDEAGTDVDLSSDGKIIAVGAKGNSGNGSRAGHVRVYAWDIDALDWTQMGSDIEGEAKGDIFGVSLSLSADGKTLAAVSTLNNGNAFRGGHARVFSWDEDLLDWKQVGEDLDGEENDITRSVALSSDGMTLVVGAWGTGYVQVFGLSDGKNQSDNVFP